MTNNISSNMSFNRYSNRYPHLQSIPSPYHSTNTRNFMRQSSNRFASKPTNEDGPTYVYDKTRVKYDNNNFSEYNTNHNRLNDNFDFRRTFYPTDRNTNLVYGTPTRNPRQRNNASYNDDNEYYYSINCCEIEKYQYEFDKDFGIKDFMNYGQMSQDDRVKLQTELQIRLDGLIIGVLGHKASELLHGGDVIQQDFINDLSSLYECLKILDANKGLSVIDIKNYLLICRRILEYFNDPNKSKRKQMQFTLVNKLSHDTECLNYLYGQRWKQLEASSRLIDGLKIIDKWSYFNVNEYKLAEWFMQVANQFMGTMDLYMNMRCEVIYILMIFIFILMMMVIDY